ncbi:MAG TPA: NUDIX domain-containing protein [Solirubrobacteraceae bacterium]|nr:NUDIX domain-containing protein [Solirubrobacteraceae bacterium]
MTYRASSRKSSVQSAGLLLYRGTGEALEVLLVHPGGPFWARRDAGVWSIPKGETVPGEDPLAAARREFAEELGSPAPAGEPIALGDIRQKSGKRVTAWALAGDLDPETVRSNTFTMQWPPKSGRQAEFPEVDRAGWFSLGDAREKLIPAQAELLDRLAAALSGGGR